jgi:molybdopterin converting factor small subunit
MSPPTPPPTAQTAAAAVATATTVTVRVLFFASAREAAGGDVRECTVELSLQGSGGGTERSAAITTATLRTALVERYPGLAAILCSSSSGRNEDTGSSSNVTLAVNEAYVPSGQEIALRDGDTVALIPPISGGWG